MVTVRAIICALITLVCPPIGIIASLACMVDDFESWRIYIVLIAFTIGMFAYYYEPTTESDLVRYFSLVEKMMHRSFGDAVQVSLEHGYDALYSYVALFWIVGLLGDVHLLPFISTFLVYYISFYITCKYIEDAVEENKRSIEFIVFILIAANFYTIVNNVRNILAFALIALAVFRECHLKKRTVFTYALYVIGYFMHSSAIVLIFFRLLLPVIKKIKIPLLVGALIIPEIIIYISPFIMNINSGNAIVNRMIRMIRSAHAYYTHIDSSWAITVANSGSQKLYKLFILLFAVLNVVLYFVYAYKLKPADKQIKAVDQKDVIIDFAYYCAILTIICVPMVMPEYWRFGCINILCGAGLFVQSCLYLKKFNQYIRLGYYVCGLGLLVLWFRNLNLYSDVETGFFRTLIFGPLPSLVMSMFDVSAFTLL